MAVQPMPELGGQAKRVKVKAAPKRNKKAPHIPSAATFVKVSCEGVKRLGGIHVPEVRGGQGNKYKLGVALNRYASQQAALARASSAPAPPAGRARHPLQPLAPQPLLLGRRPPQPGRQAAAVRGKTPAPPAQGNAAGQGGTVLPAAPDAPTTRKRRRRLKRRRRKAAATAAGPEAEAAAAGGDAAGSGQARRPSPQPAAARRQGANLEALRMRKLPPGLQVGAGRAACPVPWRL